MEWTKAVITDKGMNKSGGTLTTPLPYSASLPPTICVHPSCPPQSTPTPPQWQWPLLHPLSPFSTALSASGRWTHTLSRPDRAPMTWVTAYWKEASAYHAHMVGDEGAGKEKWDGDFHSSKRRTGSARMREAAGSPHRQRSSLRTPCNSPRLSSLGGTVLLPLFVTHAFSARQCSAGDSSRHVRGANLDICLLVLQVLKPFFNSVGLRCRWLSYMVSLIIFFFRTLIFHGSLIHHDVSHSIFSNFLNTFYLWLLCLPRLVY